MGILLKYYINMLNLHVKLDETLLFLSADNYEMYVQPLNVCRLSKWVNFLLQKYNEFNANVKFLSKSEKRIIIPNALSVSRGL